MDIREASHPNEFKSYSTDRMRQEFLIQDLFKPGEIKLVYSLYDRMIAGGVCPDRTLTLEPHKDLGTDYFLERREMGIINVGSPGTVSADGQEYVLNLIGVLLEPDSLVTSTRLISCPLLVWER